MNLLHNLIGVEAGLAEVARTICALAQSLAVPAVGAYHLTCSDETEWCVADVFHKVVAESLLPPLRPGEPAVFHTMNLGARYEPGSLRIAEHHYPASVAATKLMVVKINSHVAVGSTPGGPRYGTLLRYGVESACCGALSALLAGAALPAVDELRRTFQSDGVDRVAMLRDAGRIRPEHRALFAAVANARLQAAQAVAELTAEGPSGPSLFLIVPCVTINRETEDSEVVVGQYGVDATEDGPPSVRYQGLGDVPLHYRLHHQDERIVLTDNQWPEPLGDARIEAEPRGEDRHHAARDVPSAYCLDQHDERIVLGRDPWPKDGPA
ncbi:MAG: hypothetical protein JW719_08180 [Pirellulales bacterium]|nr:hypothetical protein [Pirellulales bacterium]